MSYKEIVEHLKEIGDAKIAEHSQRFFKTGKGEYGYGDIFLGIRVPAVREVVKEYKGTSLSDTTKLLKSKYHEVRIFAVILLVEKYKKADDKEREKIYNLYLDHTKYINNWDLVDLSAHHIVGAFLEDKDKSILDQLAKSDMLWERRIAMISTFFYIRKKNFTDALRIAKLLLNDKEDLIHKAVGWMLREIGKKDESAEKKFLKPHYKKMPRTMLRYAIERFDEDERQGYLKGTI